MKAHASPALELRTLCGQPSWRLRARTVEAWVSAVGGHLAPVTFDRRGRKLRPFAVAPWWNEALPAGTPPILRGLRGDFFCLPFGGNATPFRGERHPLHGETANRRWALVGLDRQADRHTLHLRLKTRVRAGTVDKQLTLVDGHNAVYCRHAVSGMVGPMNFGHHAMLRFPDQGAGRLSCSGFEVGLVPPEPIEQPAARGYSLLRPGAEFQRLDAVPTVLGSTTDLGVFPARRGYEDLALLVTRPAEPFAWIAVAFSEPRYVWFALKDARVLRQTLLWLSNGGRHYPPWNGRHVQVLGIEDLTAYFHYGLAESASANPLTARGVATCVELRAGEPLTVNYIMAAVPVPAAFDRVASIEPGPGAEEVTLRAEAGTHVTVPLWHGFLKGDMGRGGEAER